MRSFDEFLAKTLCSGGDGSGGGGGDDGYGGSNYFDSDAYNAGMDVGPGGQSFAFSDSPGGFDGTGDATLTDATNIQALKDAKDMTFGAKAGRALGNTFAGFLGFHNPGPREFGAGMKASPGFQFNPGALAGSWLGAGVGVPGIGALGAQGWLAANDRFSPTQYDAPISPAAPPAYQAPSFYSPPDPYQGYGDTLADRLRAAGIRT